MNQTKGEGIGSIRVAVDLHLKPKFSRFPLGVQQEIKSRLVLVPIDPSTTRAMLVEGQYHLNGIARDSDKWYYYNVRCTYNPITAMVILVTADELIPFDGIN